MIPWRALEVLIPELFVRLDTVYINPSVTDCSESYVLLLALYSARLTAEISASPIPP